MSAFIRKPKKESMMNLRSTFLAASSSLLLSSTAMAYTFQTAPTGGVVEQSQGDVNFVTGGIGDEETAMLENARDSYNVHVMNSSKDGAFTGDIATLIYDQKGNEIVATDAGPLLYVSLPPGRYTMVTEYQGMQQKKTFRVQSARKSIDLHMTWN